MVVGDGGDGEGTGVNPLFGDVTRKKKSGVSRHGGVASCRIHFHPPPFPSPRALSLFSSSFIAHLSLLLLIFISPLLFSLTTTAAKFCSFIIIQSVFQSWQPQPAPHPPPRTTTSQSRLQSTQAQPSTSPSPLPVPTPPFIRTSPIARQTQSRPSARTMAARTQNLRTPRMSLIGTMKTMVLLFVLVFPKTRNGRREGGGFGCCSPS